MIQRTMMVFGPGGIGKSPLDEIMREDVARIDPYRLRQRPRDRAENGDSPDLFYAHRNLRSELHRAFISLGDRVETLSTTPVVEWFPTARTTFFDVRGEWQCLLLGSLEGLLAKAEIFGPAVPVLFQRQDVRALFGQLSIVILNPVDSLRDLNGDYGSLKAATEKNCHRAGRSEKDIKKRVSSLDDPQVPEANAWLQMLALDGAIEFPNWPYPEYLYRENRASTLVAARKLLVSKSPTLEEFFKAEEEIGKLPGTA